MHVEDYMNETPTCLLAMLTQTREDLWQAAKALTERGVTRIILTGSGTSYHGALTARSFMQQWCGLPVDVYWPFLLDDSALTLSDKALVIGISQGGGSLSTLAAMERARAAGHLTALHILGIIKGYRRRDGYLFRPAGQPAGTDTGAVSL